VKLQHYTIINSLLLRTVVNNKVRSSRLPYTGVTAVTENSNAIDAHLDYGSGSFASSIAQALWNSAS